MTQHLRTVLVFEELEMAVAQRWPAAVTVHVDGLRCPEWSGALSMDPVGDCVDNAVAGSFFATLECWLLDRTTPTTHGAAPAAVFEFIEGWHNTRRRHFELGYHLPLDFERLHQARPVDVDRPQGSYVHYAHA